MEVVVPHRNRLENTAAINAGTKRRDKDKSYFTPLSIVTPKSQSHGNFGQHAAAPYFCHVARLGGAGDQLASLILRG